MISIIPFLAERLSEIDDGVLVDVCDIAGIDPGVARRARTGEAICAGDALCLLAALGRDPLTRKIIPPFRLGRLDHHIIALGLRAHMRMRHHTLREAAKIMGTSLSSVANMRQARLVSLSNVVKACEYLGLHPFNQCTRVTTGDRTGDRPRTAVL